MVFGNARRALIGLATAGMLFSNCYGENMTNELVGELKKGVPAQVVNPGIVEKVWSKEFKRANGYYRASLMKKENGGFILQLNVRKDGLENKLFLDNNADSTLDFYFVDREPQKIDDGVKEEYERLLRIALEEIKNEKKPLYPNVDLPFGYYLS